MAGRRQMVNEFLRGQRFRYAGALAAMGASTAAAAAVPLVTRWTIDCVIGDKPMTGPAALRWLVGLVGGRADWVRHLWLAGLAIVVLTAAAGLFQYLRDRWMSLACESAARRLRNRLFEHLNALPCAYHDKAPTGDLVQRCTSDLDTVRGFLGGQVLDMGRSLLLVLIGLPIMLMMSPRLTAVAVALMPVVMLFTYVFYGRIRRTYKVSDESEGRLTTVLQENLTGIRVVRAFARRSFEEAKFAERNDEFRDTNIGLVRQMAWFWSSSDALCHLQNALVIVFGAYWLMTGSITAGTLWAFIQYEMMFIWPIRGLARQLTELGKTQISMGRLAEILDVPPETATSPQPESANGDRAAAPGGLRFAGAVSFQSVRFSYDGSTPVVAGVSFDVAAGQTVALLGHSGSGKSTLMHLLLRLYDYQAGSIQIDGRELRDLDRSLVRGQIGAVLQEPFLFSRSLRDNIRLGHAPAGEADVVVAAEVACIHDAISTFTDGYDTIVGERGVTLSGGQRQRVALARAILRDPPIVVLDDALSAVDTQTEAMILNALRSRRGRATTLVIAHRLSTLMAADRIIVLDAGRVVQSGDHQTLVDQDGLYQRLWRIQSDLAEDLDHELADTAEAGPGRG